MGDFFATATQFPVVLFTFPLVVVIGYWLFAALTGLGGDLFGAAGTDASDGAGDTGGAGGFAGLLAALGLGGVPVTVVFSCVIAVAWFVALVGTAATAHPLARIGVLVLALWAGWQATWLLARLLRRVPGFAAMARNADLVGLLCEVRVRCSATEFGQGLVSLPDGGTALLDIRADGEEGAEPLPPGTTVLIYDYDPEGDFYRVAPAGAAADPLG
ncbi:hypothetical protein [Streptomyces sp. ST2-7A]|uniref:hypothetical protein n=1 Tax=Streptomyces sp. ST2-7A TaxID=2907214 RepID=UPI001F2E8525|nr:hypothetical protein [Streptomyces sp. ST2-7A]MCE7080588.1 hypothetical protein [Streptomyces sp. ST2-7A]